jgi:hypothetical protein
MKLTVLLASLILGAIVLICTGLMLTSGVLSFLDPVGILTIILSVIGIALMAVAMSLWRSSPDTGIIIAVIMGMGAIQLSVLLCVLLFIANQLLQALGQIGG